jgi:hypothetical protein
MEEYLGYWQANIHELHISGGDRKALAFSANIMQIYGVDRDVRGYDVCEFIMKRSRAYKSYPTWRQRDTRTFLMALAVGAVAAAITGLVVYFASRGR